MLNQAELLEFLKAEVLIQYAVELFDEEGAVGKYTLAEAEELADDIFNVEISAIGLYAGSLWVGQLSFANEYNHKRDCPCTDIYDHSDTPAGHKLAEKVYNQYY